LFIFHDLFLDHEKNYLFVFHQKYEAAQLFLKNRDNEDWNNDAENLAGIHFYYIILYF